MLNLKLTKLNVMAIVGVGVFLFLVIVISVIAYTPVRELIPGYPDENTVRNIYLNNFRLDSLETGNCQTGCLFRKPAADHCR